MAFDFNRIGADGRLYFYYGIGQTWKFNTKKSVYAEMMRLTKYRSLRIERCQLINNVQYYFINLNGISSPKPTSAARIHYLLNQLKDYVEEVAVGELQLLPKHSLIEV